MRQQLVDVMSTLAAASYLVEEEELPDFLAGARQLQQQHVRPSALFVDGVAPPRGSRAAAANHQASRKVSSRTGRPLQVQKPMGVTKPPTDFPKGKKRGKHKPFESTTGMAAALHPPFRMASWVRGEMQVQPGPKIV